MPRTVMRPGSPGPAPIRYTMLDILIVSPSRPSSRRRASVFGRLSRLSIIADLDRWLVARGWRLMSVRLGEDVAGALGEESPSHARPRRAASDHNPMARSRTTRLPSRAETTAINSRMCASTGVASAPTGV